MKLNLGHISVDAGLCWIGDPCYILPNDAYKNPGHDWGEFCNTLAQYDKPGEPTAHNFKGLGVCVGTGYGDGSYPVTATIKDGRVMSVTVKFG